MTLKGGCHSFAEWLTALCNAVLVLTSDCNQMAERMNSIENLLQQQDIDTTDLLIVRTRSSFTRACIEVMLDSQGSTLIRQLVSPREKG